MKKIALVVEATRNGVRKHICDLVVNLPPEKYTVYLIYGEAQADPAWESERKALAKKTQVRLIECHELQQRISLQDFRAYRHLVKIFKEIRPDVVHCHSSKAGAAGRLAAKVCGIPKILYTPHSYAFQKREISALKRKMYTLAERLLSRYATTLTINVSEGERQEALAHRIDKPGKFTLIYNGIADKELPSKQELRRRLGLPENAYYVGITAVCVAQKDPMTFLEIARQTVQRDSEMRFVYIGEGNLLPQMHAWVAEHGLEDRIYLLGFHRDAPELVGALDIYLSAALYEGLPYSMLEAMRAGVPIVATDVVGNNEIVQNGRNGFLFPVKDVAAACKLLRQQKETSAVTYEMVRGTFQKKFSLETMVQKTEAVYDAPALL